MHSPPIALKAVHRFGKAGKHDFVKASPIDDTQLVVGTQSGHLLFYSITSRDPNPRNEVDIGKFKDFAIINSKHLLYLPVKDPTLYLFDLQRMETVGPLKETIGTTFFALGSKQMTQHSFDGQTTTFLPNGRTPLLACAIEKKSMKKTDQRTLAFFYWNGQTFDSFVNLVVPDGTKSMKFVGDHLVMIQKKSYQFFNTKTQQQSPPIELNDDCGLVAPCSLDQSHIAIQTDLNSCGRVNCHSGGGMYSAITWLSGDNSTSNPLVSRLEQALSQMNKGVSPIQSLSLMYPYLVAMRKNYLEIALSFGETPIQIISDDTIKQAVGDKHPQSLQFVQLCSTADIIHGYSPNQLSYAAALREKSRTNFRIFVILNRAIVELEPTEFFGLEQELLRINPSDAVTLLRSVDDVTVGAMKRTLLTEAHFQQGKRLLEAYNFPDAFYHLFLSQVDPFQVISTFSPLVNHSQFLRDLSKDLKSTSDPNKHISINWKEDSQEYQIALHYLTAYLKHIRQLYIHQQFDDLLERSELIAEKTNVKPQNLKTAMLEEVENSRAIYSKMEAKQTDYPSSSFGCHALSHVTNSFGVSNLGIRLGQAPIAGRKSRDRQDGTTETPSEIVGLSGADDELGFLLTIPLLTSPNDTPIGTPKNQIKTVKSIMEDQQVAEPSDLFSVPSLGRRADMELDSATRQIVDTPLLTSPILSAPLQSTTCPDSVQLLVCTDTTMLNATVESNHQTSMYLSRLLKTPIFFADTKEALQKLDTPEHSTFLISFLQQRGKHKEALGFLSGKSFTGNVSGDGGDTPVKPRNQAMEAQIVKYLIQLGPEHQNLILEYGTPILNSENKDIQSTFQNDVAEVVKEELKETQQIEQSFQLKKTQRFNFFGLKEIRGCTTYGYDGRVLMLRFQYETPPSDFDGYQINQDPLDSDRFIDASTIIPEATFDDEWKEDGGGMNDDPDVGITSILHPTRHSAPSTNTGPPLGADPSFIQNIQDTMDTVRRNKAAHLSTISSLLDYTSFSDHEYIHNLHPITNSNEWIRRTKQLRQFESAPLEGVGANPEQVYRAFIVQQQAKNAMQYGMMDEETIDELAGKLSSFQPQTSEFKTGKQSEQVTMIPIAHSSRHSQMAQPASSQGSSPPSDYLQVSYSPSSHVSDAHSPSSTHPSLSYQNSQIPTSSSPVSFRGDHSTLSAHFHRPFRQIDNVQFPTVSYTLFGPAPKKPERNPWVQTRTKLLPTGLQLFIHDPIPGISNLSPSDVLNILEKTCPLHRIPYLEFLIEEKDERSPKLHNELALLYRSFVEKYRQQKIIARESLSQQPEQLKNTAPKPTPEDGFVPAAKTVGTLGFFRNRLITFLKYSLFYEPDVLLSHFTDNDYFFEEQVILLSRVRRHHEALSILVTKINDVQAAEDYCTAHYDPRPPGAGAHRSEHSIHRLFLSVLLDANRMDLVEDFMVKFFTRLRAEDILALLPPTSSLSDTIAFLSIAFNSLDTQHRTASITESLLRSEDLLAESRRCNHISQRTLIISTTRCGFCGKVFQGRPTAAIAPDGTPYHLHCYEELEQKTSSMHPIKPIVGFSYNAPLFKLDAEGNSVPKSGERRVGQLLLDRTNFKSGLSEADNVFLKAELPHMSLKPEPLTSAEYRQMHSLEERGTRDVMDLLQDQVVDESDWNQSEQEKTRKIQEDLNKMEEIQRKHDEEKQRKAEQERKERIEKEKEAKAEFERKKKEAEEKEKQTIVDQNNMTLLIQTYLCIFMPFTDSDLALSLHPVEFIEDQTSIVKLSPGNLKLRQYQTEAVQWISRMAENGLNCVYADESGLGKRPVVLSYLYSLISASYSPHSPPAPHPIKLQLIQLNSTQTSTNNNPFLVVCESLSIAQHWMMESMKWFPQMHAAILDFTACTNPSSRQHDSPHLFPEPSPLTSKLFSPTTRIPSNVYTYNADVIFLNLSSLISMSNAWHAQHQSYTPLNAISVFLSQMPCLTNVNWNVVVHDIQSPLSHCSPFTFLPRSQSPYQHTPLFFHFLHRSIKAYHIIIQRTPLTQLREISDITALMSLVIPQHIHNKNSIGDDEPPQLPAEIEPFQDESALKAKKKTGKKLRRSRKGQFKSQLSESDPNDESMNQSQIRQEHEQPLKDNSTEDGTNEEQRLPQYTDCGVDELVNIIGSFTLRREWTEVCDQIISPTTPDETDGDSPRGDSFLPVDQTIIKIEQDERQNVILKDAFEIIVSSLKELSTQTPTSLDILSFMESYKQQYSQNATTLFAVDPFLPSFYCPSTHIH
ncbi:putative vesicle fusion protein [Blattamonas nauphoetae]|uniref:Vesicle fusion protein n=1 Tax=Blattamonas nauphoetae TaxID=2049346 RepID=A0ABQ9YLX5_9EUKA|nr:putative vesicle fusion protein [Blattamonas nauphoetae]